MISQIRCTPPSASPKQQSSHHHRSGSITSQVTVKLNQLRLGVQHSAQSKSQRPNAREPTFVKMESNHVLVPVSEWPKSVAGPMVWTGTGATPASPYIIHLQPLDIEAIESALNAFKDKGLHGDEVSRETFPIWGALKERLEEAAVAVHEKQGYCVLRGLDPAKYTPEDNALIFLGIASHIGNVRGVQDSAGSMLSHITVAKQWENIPDKLRHGVHTTHGMPFHNDMGTDVLALHYRQCARDGGHTHLASAWTLYNELAANHPDTLKTLATPDWPIQITKARARYIMAPLIQYHEGKIMVSLDPGRLGRQTPNKEHVSSKPLSCKPENMSPACRVPHLTAEQIAALETLDSLAHKHKVSVPAKTGDILFVNNWGLLHARDPYTDDDCAASVSSRRHLVRLWLHNEDLAWAAPPALKTPWVAAFGYHFKDAVDPATAHPRTLINRRYPIVPAPDYHVPKYTAGSAAFVLDSSSDEEDGDDDHDAVDGDFLVGDSL